VSPTPFMKSCALITCDIVNINLVVFAPTFLSPYAFSGVEYVNWICSLMLLAVQKPGKRKRCTFRPLSVKALPYNRWKSCLAKGSPTGPKSLQEKKALSPFHHHPFYPLLPNLIIFTLRNLFSTFADPPPPPSLALMHFYQY
jgi:hypothetical protein